MLKQLTISVAALAICGASTLAADNAKEQAALPGIAQTLKKNIPLEKSAYQLNIVYFLGNDTQPVADYERRLSELLICTQQFYGQEMKRNGFGARSFGMNMKTPDRVDFIVYKAKHPAKDYPYYSNQGPGGVKAIQELEEYFKAHPGMKKSQHVLVIMPTWNDNNNGPMNPGGVPFYGMGKYCFALDYPAFDIKHMGMNTREGHLLTKWFGGMVHELGHGLNLPHNHATTTDGNKLGTALMGAGNYTLGMRPTFITPASCALLDVCEVFATSPEPKFYTGRQPAAVKEVSITFKGDNIDIAGAFNSARTVKSLNIYVENPPYAVNQDYENVSFTVPLNKKEGAFKTVIDRKELGSLNTNEFRITLWFLMDNGERLEKHYTFYLDNLKDYKETAEK